ncbi:MULTISPECIES: D-alanyl-lipoteichoic acid biosynthesis protein DltB [unclassified Sporolactobacillus]|uniref:D-alanyl-lipoteichoic acid biosynthesis protein DltB n=1 Tax=unclassified Sporolactobacillus TaxID=2628533 RepID=UPI00236808D0|nr:D-alanyl-lipoteichoic acid biosynthesis protein DltB [Sporolactobacillus sp. CQH2019]MDD9149031.1 D-alanyl-lipoteichoic acid biosynthesis protein DltB [Sporolactobacillus sp. CQH2019]
MISFIPYASFRFFIVTGILLLPIILAGIAGKRMALYNDLIAIAMIFLIFYGQPAQFVSIIVFIIWQAAVIKGYGALQKRDDRSGYFYAAVVLAIVPLFFVKLSADVPSLGFFGFLGISYVSFRSIEVIMDLRDGLVHEIPLNHFLRFILFFPTISSGPIDRYRRFESDLKHVPSGEEYKELLYLGINKIFQGFLYKYIIAQLVHQYWMSSPALASNTFFSIWMYMYAYSMYLFFDFAGYSQFAIGFSYIMGVRTPENFNKPFLSRNIKDFWNRWHMSLSFWFRDFIYMRFVYMMIKKKWIKDRYLVSDLGLLLNFLIMGFWHGFLLQYIIYGLYHAAAFISFNRFERFNKKHRIWPKDNKWIHALSVLITFHVICFSFLIFSGRLNFL